MHELRPAFPLPDALSRDRKLVFRDELGHEAGARDSQGVLAELSRLGANVRFMDVGGGLADQCRRQVLFLLARVHSHHV